MIGPDEQVQPKRDHRGQRRVEHVLLELRHEHRTGDVEESGEKPDVPVPEQLADAVGGEDENREKEDVAQDRDPEAGTEDRVEQVRHPVHERRVPDVDVEEAKRMRERERVLVDEAVAEMAGVIPVEAVRVERQPEKVEGGNRHDDQAEQRGIQVAPAREGRERRLGSAQPTE